MHRPRDRFKPAPGAGDSRAVPGTGESMIVGVPKESYPDERRVALVPAGVTSLTKAGLEVTGFVHVVPLFVRPVRRVLPV